MIKLAVDAMGGDHAPLAVLEGVEKALQTFSDIGIVLYGDPSKVDLSQLAEEVSDRVELVETLEVIEGEDEPVKAIRRKKDASMVVAARAVKEGECQALISAGNTGALLAAGLLIVGRMKGIDRPGLMPVIPTVNAESPQFILMDAGANADSKPEHLIQHAHLANFYAKAVLKLDCPRIGLLNNGTEAGKGDELRKAVYEVLSQDQELNFIGNIEAKELLSGKIDIALTDGFTGNAILKTLEGTAKSIFKVLKQTLTTSGLVTKLGALLIKKSLKDMAENFDDTKQGGAVLLGVKQAVIKAHGSSNGEAIFNAIRQARTIAASGVVDQIRDYFESENIRQQEG